MFDFGLTDAETLCLIFSHYKFTWQDIPWGMFDQIKMFIQNNTFRYTQILNPQYHKMYLDIAANGIEYVKNEEVKKYLFRFEIASKCTPEQIVEFCVEYKNKFEDFCKTKNQGHYADSW